MLAIALRTGVIGCVGHMSDTERANMSWRFRDEADFFATAVVAKAVGKEEMSLQVPFHAWASL